MKLLSWRHFLRRVRKLPGLSRLRTGVSLLTPFKEQSELPKSGSPELPESGPSKPPKPISPEDRFILFVSFPYFGESSEGVGFGPEGEGIKLSDFKRPGLDPPRGGSSEGWSDYTERGDISTSSTIYDI